MHALFLATSPSEDFRSSRPFAMTKLSFIVAGVASAVGLKAFVLRAHLPLPVLILMGQTSAVGLCVAAVASSRATATRTTWLLGKNHDGTFAWWSYPLFWPYHVGLRSKLWLQHRLSHEPVFNAVGDKGWYIGGWPRTPQHLPAGGPAVLDCTCELPRLHTLPYKCLPTWDCQGPTADLIHEGVVWAEEQRRQGKGVLVHCAHGHGRSCTVLCAALIREGTADSIDGALELVQKDRPRAKLNTSQRASLQEWLQQKQKLK
mmetsp:Transcript_21590/g.59998  ORF Transcript_21590/g.59998 Transcript_21590/m.59998 type:complete len:260 (+) Transcript_21590:34-813(+)